MAIFLDTSYYVALVNPLDKHTDRANKLLKTLFSGKYGQIFTSPFIMAESGTLIAVRNPSNASKFITQMKELFIGDKKLGIILRSNDEIESSTWELMIKANRNVKKIGDVVSWVDCSNIILCRKHKIDYIASFDHHFDPYLRRIH